MPSFRPPKKGVSLSQALAAAYASAPEAEVIIETLEFRHPTLAAPKRIVNDHTSLTATLEAGAPVNPGASVVFTPCYFSLKKPSESEGGRVPELIITVGNVGLELMAMLESAKGSLDPIECTYRPYCVSDLSGPHINPVLNLTVKTVTSDTTAVSIRAGITTLANRRFPGKEYTAKNFPSLTAR